MYVSEPLGDQHDLSRLDSGRPELDRWLRGHAPIAQRAGTGRTFVWHAGDRLVVAYYTLAAHLIVREEIPGSWGRGGPRQIPSVLIARLALESSLQGRGLGGELLAEALDRIVSATETVGARLVVVDAIDEAAHRFYQHHGFTPCPGTLRLVQRLSVIRASR